MDKTVIYVKMDVLKTQGLTIADMYRVINEKHPEIKDQYVLVPEPERFDFEEILDIEETGKKLMEQLVEQYKPRKPNRAERRARRSK